MSDPGVYMRGTLCHGDVKLPKLVGRQGGELWTVGRCDQICLARERKHGNTSAFLDIYVLNNGMDEPQLLATCFLQHWTVAQESSYVEDI